MELRSAALGAKLHIGLDANSGEIVAFDLTDKHVDDASHVEPLLEQLVEAARSFMADGAYDRSGVLDAVLARNPSASFIVPPCKGGRAWTNCRNIADPARPACPLGRRAWAHELAEVLRL
jgi:IS5 family transposase